MEQISIVKIAQGYRIPLGRALCREMNLEKGDYVVIYRSDSGEISLGKPQVNTNPLEARTWNARRASGT